MIELVPLDLNTFCTLRTFIRQSVTIDILTLNVAKYNGPLRSSKKFDQSVSP